MGQGQMDAAVASLRAAAKSGGWLCLKNLHLVTPWLSALEKELKALAPHAGFRLWLTTEPHAAFPSILLQQSLKITYESPPGVKQVCVWGLCPLSFPRFRFLPFVFALSLSEGSEPIC